MDIVNLQVYERAIIILRTQQLFPCNMLIKTLTWTDLFIDFDSVKSV